MMYLLYFFALATAIFLNSHLSTLVGLPSHGDVVLLPMMAYLSITLFLQKMRYNKIAVCLLVLAVIIILFKWSIGQNYMVEIGRLLIIPMLIYICFDNLSKQESKREFATLRCLLFLFFILVCVMAIAEKTLNRHFFPVSKDIEDFLRIGYFRSVSLFWHPLMAAFFVAFFMAFVAVADFKKKYFQIFLFSLGYIALFCFDARGAILVVTCIVLPYFLWKLYKMAGERRWMILLGAVCMSFGLVYMVTETSLGSGRLMGEGLIDDSSQTRLEVFEFYKHYKHKDDLMWGHPDNYRYMMERLGAGGVENGVITLILKYGIIFTPLLLLLLFLLQHKSLSVYAKFDKWLLLIVFWGIGTMNPNLANSTLWTLWFFAYYAFLPESLPTQSENTISS